LEKKKKKKQQIQEPKPILSDRRPKKRLEDNQLSLAEISEKNSTHEFHHSSGLFS